MTRFRIIGIFEDKICTSTEFNGDGYFTGNGEEVCKGFEKAKDFQDYVDLVEEINGNGFNYEEDLIYNDVKEEELDFYELAQNSSYYSVWFSDYLYIKNFKNEDVKIKDENGLEITIKPQGYTTLCFGEYYEPTKEDLEEGNPHNNIEVNQTEKTYTCDFDIDAWISGVIIEAKDEKEAKEKLLEMSLEELIENGYVKSFKLTDIDIEED